MRSGARAGLGERKRDGSKDWRDEMPRLRRDGPLRGGPAPGPLRILRQPGTIGEDDQVIRNVDEADLKRAETEQLVRLKELELKEREQERASRTKPLKIAATAFLLIVMAVCFIVGFSTYAFRTGFLLVGLVVLWVLLFMWIGGSGNK